MGRFSSTAGRTISGNKRFDTEDDSRNNFWLALVTLGEGWHNNHHRFMRRGAQGLSTGVEIDITYYLLKAALVYRHHLDVKPVRGASTRKSAAAGQPLSAALSLHIPLG
jgi:stearoyl-CoA desaturase (delta-9 desaturase)